MTTRLPATLADDINLLERMLAAQDDGYRRIEQCLVRKQEAIREADIDAMTEACEEENGLVQKLAEVEKQRLELVGRLTEAADPTASQPWTVSMIAAAVDPEQGTSLREVSDRLRDRIASVKRQSAIVHRAADALSQHLSGLVQTIQAALSTSPTYERRGRIAVAPVVESSLDLKS